MISCAMALDMDAMLVGEGCKRTASVYLTRLMKPFQLNVPLYLNR